MVTEEIRVFLLPFAGGSSYSYYEFVKRSTKEVLFVPVEIPGRGRRFKEPLLCDIVDIANDTIQQMKLESTRPYAIFGHSMGALLGYNIISQLNAKSAPLPIHFFASGCAAPSKLNIGSPRYLLPRKELFARVYELGGTHPDLQNDEQLNDFFEPILRADFRAFETYIYKKRERFNLPLTVINGELDKFTDDQLLAWTDETNFQVDIVHMPGNHFFFLDNVDQVVSLINEKITASG